MSPDAAYLLQDQVMPRLISAIPNAVPYIAPEDTEDLLQDGLCLASKMIDAAEHNGKRVVQSPTRVNGKYSKQANEVTCGNISYYTIQKLRNGRRSTGSSCSDAHGSMTQLYGRSKLTSFEEVVTDDDLGEPLLLHDVMSIDNEDPASRASRRLDWAEFMAGLSKREVAIIQCIVEGRSLPSLARKRHLHLSALSYHKNRLATAIQEYMGADIITQIQRRPGWMNSINADRERLACREERRCL